MMRADAIRPLLRDADLLALRDALRGGGDARTVLKIMASGIGAHDADAVAEHAEILLNEMRRRRLEGESFEERAGLFSDDWRVRARAAASYDRSGTAAAPWAMIDEQMTLAAAGDANEVLDGSLAASALAAALRETSDAASRHLRSALHERWLLLEAGEKDVLDRWNEALRGLLPQLAANGIAAGENGETARLKTLLAACALRGRARLRLSGERASTEVIFSLATAAGAQDDEKKRRLAEEAFDETLAASDTVHSLESSSDFLRAARADLAAAEGGDESAARRLSVRLRTGLLRQHPELQERVEKLSSGFARHPDSKKMSGRLRRLHDVVAAVLMENESNSAERARRLGAAASVAAFGFFSDWRPPAEAAGPLCALAVASGDADPEAYDDDRPMTLIADGATPVHLPFGFLKKFLPLTIEAARRRFEVIANDPKTGSALRAKCAALADVAGRLARAGWRTNRSFGAMLGIRFSPRPGEIRDGMRLHDAVPSGSFAARIAWTGKRGRKMTAGALADDDGAPVGYAAYDPLSRELRGRDLHAVYTLGGVRIGHLSFDECGKRLILGDPDGGFVTAPGVIETID